MSTSLGGRSSTNLKKGFAILYARSERRENKPGVDAGVGAQRKRREATPTVNAKS